MNVIIRIALLLTAFLPAACSSPKSSLPANERAPLAGAKIGGSFVLTDQDGHDTSDAQFLGKYRIVYFGYTFCPDVCPVDVQKIAMGLRALEKTDPALAAQVVPIFVTVDPARDTPAVLKQFVGAFHPRMVGLTGTPTQIAEVAKKFAIFYQKQADSVGGGYLVDHSRQAYLLDRRGKPLALLSQDGSPEVISAEISRWAK